MITVQQAQDLVGVTAYDQASQKVGNVAEIYYDRSTGEPEWLTVKAGLFGMKENFVPLTLARPRGQQEVEFATGKDAITGAPKIDPDGQLTAREEAQLFEHYGLSYGEQDSGLALWRAGQSRRAKDRRADSRAGWKP
jgi:PRC-barrel domain